MINASPDHNLNNFSNHPGYQRMFAEDALTIGLFLPLRFYQGDMNVLKGQGQLVELIDQYLFAAIWTRDVPLFDPSFGDAGQVFDPFTYLAWLAAQTKNVTLATGSAVFTLRHPIDLAKMATTIDQLSGGRLVLGIASGDRRSEFPAYGIDFDSRDQRFRDSVALFRELISPTPKSIHSALGEINNRLSLLPKPASSHIPLIVTGHSQQSLEWIAAHSDGWLTYPEPTHTPNGAIKLGERIQKWRNLLPKNQFKPHITNEWIDLVEDPHFPRTPQRNGFILKTGRNGLIDLLGEWQKAGVNHAALGIQFSDRPADDIIQELGEEVLPHFPTHSAPANFDHNW